MNKPLILTAEEKNGRFAEHRREEFSKWKKKQEER